MTKPNTPLCSADCGAPSPHAYLCAGCTDKLRRDLRDVAGGLLADLEVSYLRQARFTAVRSLRSSDDVPLPWDDRAASSTASDIRNAVLRWARVVVADDPENTERRSYLVAAAADVERAYAASRIRQARNVQHEITRAQMVTPAATSDAAALLLNRLEWLCQHADAGIAFTELHRAIGRAVRVVDCPPTSTFIGVCPGEWPDADACGSTLYGPAKSKQISCPDCRRLWNIGELRPYFVTQAREWLASATEISRALPALGELRATPERIRKWKQRGRLQVRGVVVRKNRLGEDIEQPLYRVADVEDLLNEDAAVQARREARKEAG